MGRAHEQEKHGARKTGDKKDAKIKPSKKSIAQRAYEGK